MSKEEKQLEEKRSILKIELNHLLHHHLDTDCEYVIRKSKGIINKIHKLNIELNQNKDE